MMAKRENAFDPVQAALDAQREAIQIPDGWKPTEAGERLIGVFRRADRVKARDKSGKERSPLVFWVDTETGPVSLWGSANLQPQMENLLQDIATGDMIACQFDGEATTSAGYKVKLYVLAKLPR